jgi:hypothetical protein
VSFVENFNHNYRDLGRFGFDEKSGIVTEIPEGSLPKYAIERGFRLVLVNGVPIRPGSVRSMIIDEMKYCSVVRLEFDTKDTRIARDAPSRLVLSPVASVADHTALLDMSKSDTVMCVALDEITKDDPVIVDQQDPLLPECPVSFFLGVLRNENIFFFDAFLENRCAWSQSRSPCSNVVTMFVGNAQRTIHRT